MLHVGLTGNIASGKSSAALFFAELGAHVIDADRVAHALLKSGTPVYRGIIDAFGDQVLSPGGEIDRRILGRMVFANAQKRELLNTLTHPAVESEILRRIAELEQSASHGIIIVDAALMIETGGFRMYHRLIVVACNPSLQVSRLMSRDGLTEEEARARMASQMPIEEKLKLADYRIDASGTMSQTRDQVEAIYEDLRIQELRIEDLQHRN
jgi:dephospho-CoA kinase